MYYFKFSSEFRKWQEYTRKARPIWGGGNESDRFIAFPSEFGFVSPLPCPFKTNRKFPIFISLAVFHLFHRV